MPYATISIKHSVGRKGFNLYDDTLIIQQLLNEHLLGDGVFRAGFERHRGIDVAPGELLVEDGICGEKTIAAITEFQIRVQHRGRRSDGRVDPPKGSSRSIHRSTWWALNGSVDMRDVPPVYLSPKLMGKIRASLGQIESYQMFRQGHFTAQLGHRVDRNKDGVRDEFDPFATIRSQGCCLCTLTMAATVIGQRVPAVWPRGLKPADLTPEIANAILHKGGAQLSGGLDIAKASKLLGMEATGYGRSQPLPENTVEIIRQHVADGKPVALHVDYRDRKRRGKTVIHTAGDHWVLIVGLASDGYKQFRAIDPATGTEMWFTSTFTQSLRAMDLLQEELEQDLDEEFRGKRKTTKFHHGKLFGIASPSGKVSEKGRRNQNNYIGVRFYLLDSASA